MKILLDENLPKKLKIYFAGEHEIFTVREKKWNGKRNGELLGLMTLSGFDAFVTIDKDLQFQQNIKRFLIKLFIIDAPNNKIETLSPYVEKLIRILSDSSRNQIVVINSG